MRGFQLISVFLFLAFAKSTTASIGRFLPFSGFYPIPRRTPEPINIISRQTYPIFTPKPLTFEGNFGQEPAFITNTGSSVQVFMINSSVTDTVTGGPLYGNVYRFRQTIFYWTKNTDGVAYTTVNGKDGSALEVAIIYVNLKYGTLTNAVRYRDGAVTVLFRIQIGSKFNPKFERFAASMKKIRKPGPLVSIKLLESFEWFYNFPQNVGYYAYPGALSNETTGETTGGTSYCTTTIPVDPSPSQFISRKQFEDTFSALLKNDGTPLTNQKKQQPRGPRPVARGEKVQKLNSNKVVYYSS